MYASYKSSCFSGQFQVVLSPYCHHRFPTEPSRNVSSTQPTRSLSTCIVFCNCLGSSFCRLATCVRACRICTVAPHTSIATPISEMANFISVSSRRTDQGSAAVFCRLRQRHRRTHRELRQPRKWSRRRESRRKPWRARFVITSVESRRPRIYCFLAGRSSSPAPCAQYESICSSAILLFFSTAPIFS